MKYENKIQLMDNFFEKYILKGIIGNIFIAYIRLKLNIHYTDYLTFKKTAALELTEYYISYLEYCAPICTPA